jgi:hypothetical protein
VLVGTLAGERLSRLRSENTPEGRKTNKLGQTLLNGNQIAMIVPGRGPEDGGNSSVRANAAAPMQAGRVDGFDRYALQFTRVKRPLLGIGKFQVKKSRPSS